MPGPFEEKRLEHDRGACRPTIPLMQESRSTSDTNENDAGDYSYSV